MYSRLQFESCLKSLQKFHFQLNASCRCFGLVSTRMMVTLTCFLWKEKLEKWNLLRKKLFILFWKQAKLRNEKICFGNIHACSQLFEFLNSFRPILGNRESLRFMVTEETGCLPSYSGSGATLCFMAFLFSLCYIYLFYWVKNAIVKPVSVFLKAVRSRIDKWCFFFFCNLRRWCPSST